MSAHDNNLHLAGRIKANAHLANLLIDSGDLDLSEAVIDTRDVTLRDPNVSLSDWWSSFELHDAKLRPSHRVQLDTMWTARLASVAPILALSKRTPSLPAWTVRLLTGGEVKASGRLRVGKALIELSQIKAQTGLLNVEGDFRQRGEAKVGVFRVSSGPLSVGIESNNDETKLIFIGRPVEPALMARVK